MVTVFSETKTVYVPCVDKTLSYENPEDFELEIVQIIDDYCRWEWTSWLRENMESLREFSKLLEIAYVFQTGCFCRCSPLLQRECLTFDMKIFQEIPWKNFEFDSKGEVLTPINASGNFRKEITITEYDLD